MKISMLKEKAIEMKIQVIMSGRLVQGSSKVAYPP
jgi:hypothetical protein